MHSHHAKRPPGGRLEKNVRGRLATTANDVRAEAGSGEDK